MSASPAPNRDYCDNLLIQQAVYGLSSSEQSELAELNRDFVITADDRFEVAVGALDVGFFASPAADELPANLQAKVIAEASRYLGATRYLGQPDEISESRSSIPKQQSQLPGGGWSVRERFFGLVTAASLLLALLSLSGMLGGPAAEPDRPTPLLAEQLELLLATADTQRLDWDNPTKDLASQQTTGEVVWNNAQQKGFMIFEGFQVNVPAEKQYQLWIFDTARNDELPVDGGVFDVTSAGKLIVPIDSKLPITNAKAFAVTIEDSGGVVQSKRERLPLLAGKL